MASYEAWNAAIADYFTAGVAKGSHIFISLDEEAIEEIATSFLEEAFDDDPLYDFIYAIREQCGLDLSAAIDIRTLQRYFGSIPSGVGFLGSMVLAAYRMQDEEGINETNYFYRFRETMHLPPIQGRPDGMPAGTEEPLWIAWNKFLVDSGFQPSAERGAGPQTYLKYVFSQAILRESDKQFLAQRYREDNIPLQLDCDQLGFWLSRQQITRKHLQEGLHHPDPARVWEFYKAAYRIYETGNWLREDAGKTTSYRQRTSSIESGLYREETLHGDARYFVFPKQPVRSRSGVQLVVLHDNDDTESLRPLRPGFFRPLWKQEPFVDEPLQFAINGDPSIQKLIFPKRDFWILSPDPETPFGAFATWKPYLDLGEKLLVICRSGPFVSEMLRFKEAKLVDWSSQITYDNWTEFQSCMVLSYDWGGYICTPECRPLADALAPRTTASIALSGGLRDPNQNAWLVGYPPTVKVYGFEKQFEINIASASGFEAIDHEISQQDNLNLPNNLEPDTYTIEAKWNGKRVATRIFRIISWEGIQENPNPDNVVNSDPISSAGLRLHKPVIINDEIIHERGA